MSNEASHNNWSGTTFGTGMMHTSLILLLSWVDVRVIYVFASVFVVPICLLCAPSGKLIYKYFRLQQGYTIGKALWMTYKNHCMFSQIVIDKFAMWAGKKFDIKIEGYEYFLNLADKPDGFVQLSAHIGNYEIAGYNLVAETKRFNALVFFGEKESVMENREKMFGQTNIHMIPIKADMSHVFEIDRCLANNEIVSMPADRLNGSSKHVTKTFMGSPAKFPLGPFSITTLRGLETIAVNVMKTRWNAYIIHVTPLHYDKDATRKEQIRQLSDEYVRVLEDMLKRYPTQWFNYYDFWS